MDLTSNKEKLTTATGICPKTENSAGRGGRKDGERWSQLQNRSNIHINIRVKKIYSKLLEGVREAQTLAGTLLDLEQLVEAQSILVPSESLLVQLELP